MGTLRVLGAVGAGVVVRVGVEREGGAVGGAAGPLAAPKRL